MKKGMAVFLLLCICLSLAACGLENLMPRPGSNVRPPEPQETMDRFQTLPTEEITEPDITEPVASEPETTAPDQAEMLRQEFVSKVKGVWIFGDTIERYGEEDISFLLMVFKEKACFAGFYLGEADRPGLYEGITKHDDSTYQLDLLFEEGLHMGDYLSEARSTITFVLLGNGRMQMQYANGDSYMLTYGGDTVEAAGAVAYRMAPYIPPTEPPTEPTVSDALTMTPATWVVSEHSGYRIVREDRSVRNSAGQVLVSQYYDYVELTADTPAAQKINRALKPTDSDFRSLDQLEGYAQDVEPGELLYEQTSGVTYLSEQWLCVTTSYDWFMGGVFNNGNSGAVFDMSTGDRATLRAFAGADPAAFEEKLKQIVWEQIEPLGPWENAYEKLSGYSLDTFDFAIPNGQIVLFFPEYEFFAGAAAPVVVETGLYIG